MIDRLTLHRWLYALLLLTLCSLVIFARLLPLEPGPSRFPGPDVILALCTAWVMRRPDYVPVLLVAFVLLMTDMLFQRPPGLHTALVVLALEFLRRRETHMRDLPFAVEWAMVAGTLAAVLIIERMVLGLFFVDQVSFGLSILRLLMTVAIYPIVVVLSAAIFGVRRITAAEAEAMRRQAAT
jgi:rod shape-determining protein MreD